MITAGQYMCDYHSRLNVHNVVIDLDVSVERSPEIKIKVHPLSHKMCQCRNKKQSISLVF